MRTTESAAGCDRGSLAYFGVLCFIAALGGLLFGFDTAVISGARELLVDQFKLGPGMEGWLVASALVGCLIGAGVGGWLSDLFGRKRVLMLSAALFTLTSIGCAVAPEPHLLIVARLIGGIGVGIASMVVPLYIAEISPAHLRGRMVSFYQFAITIGVLAAYLSNAALHAYSERAAETAGEGFWRWMLVDEVWRAMLGTMVVPAVAFLLLLLPVPESPRWLTKQGEDRQAEAILARIAGSQEAQRQMIEIRETIAEERGGLEELLRPGTRLALAMAVFLAISGQFSGINAIIYYGPKIFGDAGFRLGGALGGQVVLGLVNVVFTVVAIVTVDTLGRRPLLAAGNTGVFASLVLLAVLFFTGATWPVPLILVMSAYLAFFAISLGPLPWIFMSEVFPTRVRGRAMSIATLMLWAANTVVCFSFPLLETSLGPARIFCIYAAMICPVFLFVARYMPETKGRSLEQLERFFRGERH
jgi:SP family arabinose:H+ symporter-like MFS transporter